MKCCTKCRKEISDIARFYPYCGEKQVRDSANRMGVFRKYQKVVALVLVCSMIFGAFSQGLYSVYSQPVIVSAAGKNKKAGDAFAKAITVGKISYKAAVGDLPYEKGDLALVEDLDSDGVKELVIIHHKQSLPSFTVWKYAKGKVSKLAGWNKAAALTDRFGWGCYMLYDKKNKVFWCIGDADGGWMAGYRLEGKKVKEKVFYDRYLAFSGKYKVHKIVNGKSTEISLKKYEVLRKNIRKNGTIPTISKTKLIQKLKNMK